MREAILTFIILFIIVFLVDYFLINKRKLKIIKNKGVLKNGKKKKIKPIGEMDYLVTKFNLNKRKLKKDKIIIAISLINSFIIAFVSSVVMFIPFRLMWQMLIAFVLLFALIYSLYELYGRSLKKKESK